MPRFFVDKEQIGVDGENNKTVLVMGEDSDHIRKSLRMKEGDEVTVCDKEGKDYICKIKSTGDNIVLSVIDEKESKAEPPYSARVFQALVKGDKFDTVVQKAVECGACEIIPFSSERCVMRLDKKDCTKKIARWQKIAAQAAKQCGRGIIPTVSFPMTFEEAVKSAAESDIPVFCYECEKTESLKKVIKNAEKRETISVMIGSEGGFSQSEAQKAIESGMISTGLGERILRTETASSFVLACLSFELEN